MEAAKTLLLPRRLMNTYKTGEIARLAGVHPNTVRFYEEAGFITPPHRQKNGYRIFTELHLSQMRLVRLAMRAEVLQNGLRKKAIEVIRLCALCDFDGALQKACEYAAMLTGETQNAKAAAASVQAVLSGKNVPDSPPLKRLEAAQKLHVTVDTLRNWELNGLVSVRRLENGYRVYGTKDLERLNIIRTLRCAGYSLSAILRLMSRLDKKGIAPVEKILNTPSDEEDIVSVCDRLITSLENTQKDALEMQRHLTLMRDKFQTLQ
jgi:DNA-binding transcriptional MerR regulator